MDRMGIESHRGPEIDWCALHRKLKTGRHYTGNREQLAAQGEALA